MAIPAERLHYGAYTYCVNSAEIRETFLAYFEHRDHRRLRSASLVPASFDPSVLLTTAGMQPLKPYFQGLEKPPHSRLASCQKCFRTTDIDQVGLTARHLTFFEMLGNFSIDDYFKEEAIAFGWELSLEGFGFPADRIWVTVFEGDKELGLGPDEEAIACWRSVGVPDERIVRLPRSDNFWQAGSAGPCGPCSELYLDRGSAFGGGEDRPGDDTERFLEYWNLVFMQYNLGEDGSLEELPSKNIDTGLGLDRMAAILQDAPSVFETDLLKPLVELGEELSVSGYGQDRKTTKALRILADHGRAMTFLAADGVVPSNEDRGYILRRVMRRAIYQGRIVGIGSPFLDKFAERVIEQMGSIYPELRAERSTVLKWVLAEEESFLRTLDQGTQILDQLVSYAKKAETSWVDAEDAFRLHDTYGFPYDLTKDMLAEEGLTVDDDGFRELMEEQRARARMGIATAHGAEGEHQRVLAFAEKTESKSTFVGYELLESETTVTALEAQNGKALAKLSESPFYAEGGGQVADVGVLASELGTARVEDVYRVGQDQVVLLGLEQGKLKEGEVVRAVVDSKTRHATARNHTATHLLHAALRERLGMHVRQAGSSVRPDKLRFDFTHGKALSAEDVLAVEDRVNEWIAENRPVRALEMSRRQAEELGAMALFGEKYGDWVRVIEVEGVSRELCGGTHVGLTAEVGVFKVTAESSSAANVRRIEALTGPAAAEYYRARDRQVAEIGNLLKVRPDDVLSGVERQRDQNRKLMAELRSGGASSVDAKGSELAASAQEIGGIKVVGQVVEGVDLEGLRELSDRVSSKLGDSVVVLGAAGDGRCFVTIKLSKTVAEQGVRADEVIAKALAVAGGKGGGRDTMAQGGGRDPEKLEEVIEVALREIKAGLSG